MSKIESGSRNSQSKPLLTIQIHRGAAAFVVALAAVALGAFVLGRMWRHASVDAGQQTRIQSETTADNVAAKFTTTPVSHPEDSGWRRDWRKDTPAPQSAREMASEPAGDQDGYDLSRATPAVEVHRQQVTETRIFLPQPPASEPEPQPAAENITDEPLSVPSRSIDLSDDVVTLRGAGATFPHPIYAMWFDRFHRIHPQITIDYQSKGSGAGIRQLLMGTIDFGATDGPMTDQQLREAKTRIVHIPTVLAAVVPIYNIPGIEKEIRFTPAMLAGIFLGKISSWNDEVIAKANPDIHFPDLPITVVHHVEGAAVTFDFTDYLSKVSSEWNERVGRGMAVHWPTGIGNQGCEGVSATVRQIKGAISYVQLIYALQNKEQFGSVENHSGRFIKASLASVTAAAASAELPPDFRASITNPPGDNAYPIASFTWLLIPEKLKDQTKNKDLAEFLRWMIRDGEAMASSLGYAPLPANVAEKVRAKIQQMREQQ